MAQLELFLLALSFYTRLPVPKNLDYGKLPQASICLPLVGWVVGGLTGLSFYLAHLLWPQPVAVILALVVGVLLTGAFHEDGFADVCDGFGGGYDNTQILAIMKDSRIGVYGALGLILLFSLKISLLTLMPAHILPYVFLASHSVSRFPPLLTMQLYDYASSDQSKSANAVYRPGVVNLVLTGIVSILPLFLLPPIVCLSSLFILLTNWQLGRYFFKGIGGYSGDCLGASQQVAEVVFYLSLSALWKFT